MNILILPGNNYTQKAETPFINFLKSKGCNVCYVELLENMTGEMSYGKLSPKEYSKYIDSHNDLSGPCVIYSISMGTYHAINYTHFYPRKVIGILLVEPTICSGLYKPLRMFEKYRGNEEWLDGLYEKPRDESLPTNEKTIDIALEQGHILNPHRKPIVVIETQRDNTNKEYNDLAAESKQIYVNALRRLTSVKVINVNGMHTLDLKPKHFSLLYNALLEVFKLGTGGSS